MDYLGKGEVLTNTDLDRLVNNIWDKLAFCVHRKSIRFLSSAHEKWGQKQKCSIYNFVQYNYTILIKINIRAVQQILVWYIHIKIQYKLY